MTSQSGGRHSRFLQICILKTTETEKIPKLSPSSDKGDISPHCHSMNFPDLSGKYGKWLRKFLKLHTEVTPHSPKILVCLYFHLWNMEDITTESIQTELSAPGKSHDPVCLNSSSPKICSSKQRSGRFHAPAGLPYMAGWLHSAGEGIMQNSKRVYRLNKAGNSRFKESLEISIGVYIRYWCCSR